MDELAAKRAAETLLAAHKANLQFSTLGPPDRPATVSDAYDIQQRFVALLRGAHGDAVGYKVGLTSAAMQTFCGIDHPIAGVVLARRVLQSGASVRRADYGRLGLEFEIAVRLKSDVPVTGMPLYRRDDRAAYRRRLRRDRNRRRPQRRLCQPRCAVAGGGQFLERRHRAVGIFRDLFEHLVRSGWRARPRQQRRRCDRRRPRPRHPRPSLQFGGVACHATGFARRWAEGRRGRDDGSRDENRISGS